MKNANQHRLVLFDLDGTLTDPGLGITNSVMYALREFGFSVGNREEYYKYIGPPLLNSFSKYAGASQEDALELLRLYRVYFAEKGLYENEIYPGIEDLLKELSNNGDVLCLATSKPEPYAIEILKHFKIDGYFKYAACSTMEETRTDKKDVIEYALQITGYNDSHENCIMIGDREYDILGAKANGISSIGVTYGYGSYDEVLSAGADRIAESVSSLAALLRTI